MHNIDFQIIRHLGFVVLFHHDALNFSLHHKASILFKFNISMERVLVEMKFFGSCQKKVWVTKLWSSGNSSLVFLFILLKSLGRLDIRLPVIISTFRARKTTLAPFQTLWMWKGHYQIFCHWLQLIRANEEYLLLFQVLSIMSQEVVSLSSNIYICQNIGVVWEFLMLSCSNQCWWCDLNEWGQLYWSHWNK